MCRELVPDTLALSLQGVLWTSCVLIECRDNACSLFDSRSKSLQEFIAGNSSALIEFPLPHPNIGLPPYPADYPLPDVAGKMQYEISYCTFITTIVMSSN